MAKQHSWTWTSILTADGDGILYDGAMLGCSHLLMQVEVIGDPAATCYLDVWQTGITASGDVPDEGTWNYLLFSQTPPINATTNYYFTNLNGLRWLNVLHGSNSGATQVTITFTAQELETYPAR